MIRSLLIAAMFMGASAAAAAEPVVFHRGTAAEPETLDPHLCDGNACGTPIYDIFVGLVTDDPEGHVTGGMADTWTISEDGLRYTFNLRDGLTWSDGVPITAADIVYSFRRSLAPETAARTSSLLYLIENARAVSAGTVPVEELGVAAPDPRTVTIDLERPAPYFLETLLISNAMPVPRHVIEEHGRQWTRPGTMVSNGAYVLAEWVPQSFVRVTRNPLFFDAENVAIDEVVFYPTTDLSTSLKRFRAGELDIVLNFPPSQIGWLRENMPDALRIHPTLGVYYYVFNTARPPFDDLRVRRALSIAVNRDLIVDQILQIGNPPAHGVVPPGIARHSDPYRPDYADTPYQDRLAEARALLSATGFGDDNPLTVTLRYNTQEEHERIAVALSVMWKEVGVLTELDNSDQSTVTRDLEARNFDLARYAWFAAYNDASTFLELMASGQPRLNFSGYSNPEFDALLAEAATMRDLDARADLLRRAEALAMADHPLLPIYFYVGKRLVSSAVKGWIDNPRSANRARWLRIERE